MACTWWSGLLATVVCAGRFLISEDETIFIPNCFEFRWQLSLSDVFRVVREILFHNDVSRGILLAKMSAYLLERDWRVVIISFCRRSTQETRVFDPPLAIVFFFYVFALQWNWSYFYILTGCWAGNQVYIIQHHRVTLGCVSRKEDSAPSPIGESNKMFQRSHFQEKQRRWVPLRPVRWENC